MNQCYDRSVGTYPMSEEQLKAFLEKVKDVTSLQEKLRQLLMPMLLWRLPRKQVLVSLLTT